jgi:hypothetical protein
VGCSQRTQSKFAANKTLKADAGKTCDFPVIVVKKMLFCRRKLTLNFPRRFLSVVG